MSGHHIAHHRLLAQRIAGDRLARPVDVVRWMGAMQGQDYRQALWAIGLRTNTATLADVERAIENREILFTWPMRGTLHVVPAEDANWMVRLMAARQLAADGRRQQQLGLDQTILLRCREVIQLALVGGKRLTRFEIMQLLDDNDISPQGQRGYHILWHLAQTGFICLGPMAAKEQTFVLLDEWVPHSRRLSREEGLAELARRYFVSHGPATIHDFARWTGLTLTNARAGLGAVAGDLTVHTINGTEYWQAQFKPMACRKDDITVHLLPGFDEYLLGYKNRSAVLTDEHANKVVPGGNGIFQPIIVVDGQVVGTWKRTIKKQGVEVVLLPFSELAAPRTCIESAAQRYARFLGLPLASLQCDGP